jgi:hypothetical protein
MIIIAYTSNAQTISQERAAHQYIRSFIADQYPAAKSICISDVSDGYKIRFKTQDGRYLSSFSLKKQWIETERKIYMADLPESIKQSIKNTQYNAGKVLMAQQLILPQEPYVLYLVAVRCVEPNEGIELGDIRDYNLYFTSYGKLTKTEVEPGEMLQSLPWGGQ